MLPVDGHPFLEYLVWQLANADLAAIVLSCGYRGELIREYFGDGSAWGVRIRYANEEVPLGTGGAVRLAANLVDDERFLLLNGDSACAVDIRSVLAGPDARPDLLGAMTLVSVPDAGRYGSVELTDGIVTSFRQNDHRGGGLVNAGVYCLRRSLVERIPEGPCSLERDVLPSLSGRIAGILATGFFLDMGLPETYAQVRRDPAGLLEAVGRGPVG